MRCVARFLHIVLNGPVSNLVNVKFRFHLSQRAAAVTGRREQSRPPRRGTIAPRPHRRMRWDGTGGREINATRRSEAGFSILRKIGENDHKEARLLKYSQRCDQAINQICKQSLRAKVVYTRFDALRDGLINNSAYEGNYTCYLFRLCAHTNAPMQKPPLMAPKPVSTSSVSALIFLLSNVGSMCSYHKQI